MPFKKGHKKQGGRVAGTPNKTTRDLKEAILAGAEAVGLDGAGLDGLKGYCIRLAGSEPKAFAALLGRVLPMQVSGTDPDGNPTEFIIRVVKP